MKTKIIDYIDQHKVLKISIIVITAITDIFFILASLLWFVLDTLGQGGQAFFALFSLCTLPGSCVEEHGPRLFGHDVNLVNCIDVVIFIFAVTSLVFLFRKNKAYAYIISLILLCAAVPFFYYNF